MATAHNLAHLLQQIQSAALHAKRKPEEISLVVVSKGVPLETLKEAYEVGCRDFGESRVQEAVKKIEEGPQDIRWHFIGNLQKNKVNKLVGRFTLIHSVDTPELAGYLSEASLKAKVTTPILLQSNTSGELSKSGASPEVWKKHFSQLLELKGITIHGLMTMAPLTKEEGEIRHCFSKLRHLRDELQTVAEKKVDLSTLSMGMSSDFRIAIEEGATLLRIGSAIFSSRRL